MTGAAAFAAHDKASMSPKGVPTLPAPHMAGKAIDDAENTKLSNKDRTA